MERNTRQSGKPPAAKPTARDPSTPGHGVGGRQEVMVAEIKRLRQERDRYCSQCPKGLTGLTQISVRACGWMDAAPRMCRSEGIRNTPSARAKATPLPRESLANWLRSSVGRYRHVGHTGGVCGLVRPSAAPSQVDGRSWERPFQRRDAKYVTLCMLFAFQRSHQRHSLHFNVTLCISSGYRDCGLPVICS